MSLTFQQESVVACWPEVVSAARLHWEGTKGYRRHEPFDPQLNRYADYERMGMYRLITAREHESFAGYFGLYVTHSMHSQLPMVVEDTFYLLPQYRKGRNAIRFIRFVEDLARSWQAHEILFSCEIDNAPANALVRYLDYQPVIMQYSKRFFQHVPGLAAPPMSDDKEELHVRPIPTART